MAIQPAAKPRRSREDVSAALIAAAATLYAGSSSSAVTVRKIAAEAGVNPSLVSRYFGSKDNLVRAVVERSQLRIAARAIHMDDARAGIGRVLMSLLAEKEFVAILARACLDDTLSELPTGYHAMRGLLERLIVEAQGANADAVDPRIVVACLASMGLGYGLFGEFIRRGAQLEDWSDDEIEAGLVEVARRVVDMAHEG
jgi:AcrR family transcriptional regulator